MNDQGSLRFERVAAPAYFLAFLFLALPLMDYVMTVWPLQLGQVNWRYGAFGLAGGFLLTPLLGLLMLMATALWFEHRGILLVTGIVSAFVAIALALISMSFVLDSLQMRSGVPVPQKGTFDAGVLKALVKDATGVISAGWVALGSFRGRAGLATSGKRAGGAPLVVGARTDKAG